MLDISIGSGGRSAVQILTRAFKRIKNVQNEAISVEGAIGQKRDYYKKFNNLNWPNSFGEIRNYFQTTSKRVRNIIVELIREEKY